ncbi:MAG: phosphatase PAP2 family protein [Candidatus Aminicenantes bacterium]|nr:phosphatase PAP2 family protein [Candidatus Aminicenantes bacterium]
MSSFSQKPTIFFLLVFLFFSSSQGLLLAQDSAPEDKLNKEFLVNFKNDFGQVIVSPAHWKKKDFLKLSAVLGTGLILYAVDQDIRQWVQDNSTSSSEHFSNFVTHFGDGGVLAGLIAAIYTTGELSKSNGLRKTALSSLESWLTTGVVVGVMKFTIGRARPYTEESSCSFHPFSTGSRNYSFPSGHASAAFAVATAIAEQSKKDYVDVAAYTLASLVALSRVHKDKHWASDVFVGACMGYFIAKKISALDRDRNSNRVGLNFQFGPQRQEIAVSIRF